MSNAGVSLIMQQSSVSQEAVKASSIPVPGAVVIAPLTQSWRNYGSIGGEFTKVGNPILGPGGMVAGVGEFSYGPLAAGVTSTKCTLISRVREHGIHTIHQQMPLAVILQSSTTGFTIVLPPTSATKFKYGFPSGGWYEDTTVSSDTNFHIFTLIYSGTTLACYIDGVLVDEPRAAAGYGVTSRIVLGSGQVAPYYQPQFGYNAANAVLYHTALSDTDRALVEAWAAT